MLISVKLLTKYLIKIYALGSVHEKFGVWMKRVPKSIQSRNSQPGSLERTPKPFQIETGVTKWFRRRTFHVLNSMYYRFGSWKVAAPPGGGGATSLPTNSQKYFPRGENRRYFLVKKQQTGKKKYIENAVTQVMDVVCSAGYCAPDYTQITRYNLDNVEIWKMA